MPLPEKTWLGKPAFYAGFFVFLAATFPTLGELFSPTMTSMPLAQAEIDRHQLGAVVGPCRAAATHLRSATLTG
jgi:hypothetical protein